jgi:ABC-type transport system substrate-binding protein/class 3 adenylate cyclase/streptogramin lyase
MSVPPDGGSPSVGGSRGEPQPDTGANEDADVHAFLIGDVRGWTSFTQEHGDEVAAQLAARFAEVVREVVQDHRGRVVELRGDEVLAVFGSPRSAIRAAVGLQQRFVDESTADPSLPLTVGIGLDAGEAVAVEGGYRGGALNVAGRLQARAKAGQILASREIVHLARHIDGINSIEHGSLELKGLDQPVHVIEIRSEHKDAAAAMAPFVRTTAPTPVAHKRWKVVAPLVALAVVAALIAVPLARNASGSAEIPPNSIGVLDPASGQVRSTLELEGRPGSIAASAQDVWLTNPDADTVTRIDPVEQAIVDTIPVGKGPTAIAVGEGSVWVVESGGPSVARISPDTGEVVETIDVGNGPTDVAVGEGAVWVSNRFDGTISRIDPDSGKVAEIPVGLDPRGIAVGFGSVWTALSGSNQVARIDPEANAVSRLINVGNAPGSLTVSADDVWVANTLDDTVHRVSPDTESVVDTIAVGDDPSEVAVVNDAVWVANEADGTLSRIEPGQPTASSSLIESVPQGMAGVGNDLWVSVRDTSTSHRGGTLRMLGNYTPDSLDPSGAYDSAAWSILHLLGDGLLAFEPTGSVSTQLVPDLAKSKPIPTDGGRSYTFELRPGIPYSNGETVAAVDFRRAIERVFLLEPDAHFFFRGLVGGNACHHAPRTCDLSRGIETDETTITFNLVEPDPEFLYKLTTPFAYPIPSSVPDAEQVFAGVPGTGPYVAEAPMSNEGLTLIRNPRFREWSPAAQPDGYLDRIEWTFGVPTEDQMEAVAAGKADLTFDSDQSGELDRLFVRFSSRVHTSLNAQTQFLLLNNESPPFDDPEVRRALNLVIDRDRVAEILGVGAYRPTCQQLPPNFPGYEPYCPFTSNPGPGGKGLWSAPAIDIKEARAIVRRSGTAGMHIAFDYAPALWHEKGGDLGEYLVVLLGELGYDARIERHSKEDFFDPKREFQMALGAWSADFSAASTFFNGFLTCDAAIAPLTGFCDRQVDEMAEQATSLQIDDPVAAGALWAKVDRAIVDQAPYVWLTNPNTIGFVSERVGNYQFSLQWGTLLNQLWVQ